MGTPQTLSGALDICARTAGDEVALIGRDGSTLSYGEWDRQADVLAGLISARTPVGGTVIARLGERSDALGAVALFAAIRAGRFLLPMSGRFSDSDLERAVERHRVGLVLVDDETRAWKASRPGAETLCFDGSSTSSDGSATSVDDSTVGAEVRQPGTTPAPPGGAVTYTLGTTDRPAAIRWTHSDLLSWLTGWTGAPARRPHLHEFPPDTGDALGRLVRTLLRYPGVRSRPGEPAALVELLNRYRPADLLLVAASARALVDGTVPRPDREAAAAVLSIYLTSDFSDSGTIRSLRARFPRAAVTNVYSVAEAGRGQVWQRYPPLRESSDDAAEPRYAPGDPVPVGSPIFGTEVRITDAAGRPADAGSVGRIWLRPGLPSSLGYCDGEGRPDVFADGWVRTDDLGLVDDTGRLLLAGRADDVLTLPGGQVTARQVEAVLAAEHPVDDVAVLVEADGCDPGREPVMVAAVVPAGPDRAGRVPEVAGTGSEPGGLPATLSTLLAQRFGADAGRIRVVAVAEVPRNAAGKADRRRLRALLPELPAGTPDRVPPPAPGLVSRAGLCWGQRWSWHQQQLPPGRRAPTLLFRRMIRIPDGVGPELARRAVALSVARHSSLRSTFSVQDGQPCQQVWSADGARWEFREFPGQTGCESWLAGDIDIEAGWPIRAALAGSAPGATWLGVAVHHIATDLYGFNLLCTELQTAVRAYLAGGEPSLPPVGRHAVDIAAYESSPQGVATSARTIAYWQRHAGEMAKVISTITRGAGQPADAMHVARATADIGGEQLDTIARGRGRGAVLLGAVAISLARFLGCAQVPMMLLVPNRHLPGVKHSVCALAQAGLCVVEVRPHDSLHAVVGRAWSGLVRAQAYGYCDHDELTERMTPAQVGEHGFVVTPPGVNVMQAAAVGDPGLVPATADAFPTVAVHTLDRPCLGTNFHLAVSESTLTVELRAGVHLLSAEDCRDLVSATVRSILDA
ncbi:AMP-binding protein [Plantactinospora veratri]|uniref:AMP-binding protein n=1 Tax=Plantactinospora veratri TaxID=1436122 RepID=A0ABU7SPT9_9ACTN